MNRLDPHKLHVAFSPGTDPAKPLLPRRYTLTHSDRTGDLFLSIGSEYNLKQISKIYTRLMRDEVLAELSGSEEGFILRVYCHVSGGFILGTAKWRYAIFQSELPLVLEAIRYGDKALFESRPELDNAAVFVHLQSGHKRFNKIENWGPVSRYG